MSQATVKARRREIRRAVGTEALGTIADQQQQVALLARSLTDMSARVDTLGIELSSVQRQYLQFRPVMVGLQQSLWQAYSEIGKLKGEMDWQAAKIAPLERHVAQSFCERLRWLLFGS